MLKKSWLRLGALLALLLVLAVPLAYAKTITVDGDPSDWAAAPAQGPLVTDPDEGAILQRLDIGDVYFTNDTVSLYWRIDTLAGTNWVGTTMVFCFDTDNSTATGSVDPLCNNAPGIDYIYQFTSPDETDNPLGVAGARYCAAGSCTSIPVIRRGGITGARELPEATGDTSEYGFPIFRLRQDNLGNAIANGIPTTCTAALPCLIPTRIILGNPAAEPDDDVSMLVTNIPQIPAVPTPVTLTSFTAARGAGGVELAWASSSELNIQGYHVLRSAGGREAATRITDALIPGTGSGITGGSYSYTDTTAAVGSSYSYWLEVINSDGTPEEYGPVSYAPGTAQRTSVYLPLVVR